MEIGTNNVAHLKAISNIRNRTPNISADVSVGELDDKSKQKLKQACQDFEGLFLREMLKSMRETVPESGLLGKGFADETYQDMLDQELVKRMSHSSRIGLAQILYRQLVENYDIE